MYDGPPRGGTRGGQGDFKWDDVKNDQHREYYLGHSVKAATGRWQKNKDINWYNKDSALTAEEQEEERRKELRRVKEAEEDALAQALGFAPTTKRSDEPTTSSNAVPLRGDKAKEQERIAKLERKAERARIRAERAERKSHRPDRGDDRRRSRSPDGRQHPSSRHRSRSPADDRRRSRPYDR